MIDNYYLINDSIKFYFDIENQFIEFKGVRESLEPKEAQILKYILENHDDGIIKSEAILDANWDYWSDKKVLQKVLSTLRRKFRNINVEENGFVAAGSSYKINFRGTLVNAQEQALKEKSLLKNKIIQSIKTAVLWALAGAISLLAVLKFNEHPKFTIDNVIQTTSISGVSVEPALSPDGHALAFSHRNDSNGSQIYLKVEPNLNYQALTQGHFDQVPAWSPSGHQLAFQRIGRDSCEIRLLTFDKDYNPVGPDKHIADCDNYSRLSKLTWESETSLFFTNKSERHKPYEIKKLDLKTGETSDYFSFTQEDYKGSGTYFIVYDPQFKTLYALESPDWIVTDIIKIGPDNTSTQIRQVGDVLLSIAIYKNQIIFKDLDNQLKSFSQDNPNDPSTIFKNPLKPIAYPTVSAASNRIALVSGSVFRNSIFAFDLKSHSISEIISSDFQLISVQAVAKEILFFSSQTGIYQVYSYANNTQTQLTNFTKNKRIVYFAQSRDKKWLAINFIDGTTVYRRTPYGVTEVKSFPLMSYPAFSINSKRILLKNLTKGDEKEGSEWKEELVEYYLDDFTESGISIKNASFGVYHNKGIIYASNEDKIRLFTLNGVKILYEGIVPSKPNAFSVNDDSVFIGLIDKVIQVDIDTGKTFDLPSQLRGQISADNQNVYFRNTALSTMVIFGGDLNRR